MFGSQSQVRPPVATRIARLPDTTARTHAVRCLPERRPRVVSAPYPRGARILNHAVIRLRKRAPGLVWNQLRIRP